MKQPQDDIGSSQKTLPTRKAKKAKRSNSGKPKALQKIAERKRILSKKSDLELVKTFGQK